MPVIQCNALFDNRVQAIQDFHKGVGNMKAELDLSGGIDSAVMAGLLVKALGPENVTLVHTRINTNPEQTRRAKELAKALGCPMVDLDLTYTYTNLVKQMGVALVRAQMEFLPEETFCAVEDDANDERPLYADEMGRRLREIEARCEKDKTILGSIRSCIRAPIGRGFNRLTGGGVRHGTGNECEDRWLRFYQKGGDGEVDTNPIAMLSKTEVYQLAWGLGKHVFGGDALRVYQETIAATPSPDLWGEGDGHSDESELKAWLGVPFTYGRLDPTTGKVTQIGTIERVSRVLDRNVGGPPYKTVEDLLFHYKGTLNDQDWMQLMLWARPHFPEQDFSLPQIFAFLGAATRAEKATRHKANPNIPALGTREELVAAHILSNDLNDYKIGE